ncbi:MAG: nitrogenase [Firmicutes bacterium]|nr:nitrogenase [Bacillota bacterium]
MAVFKETAEVDVRERRLHSILSYNGDAQTLIDKSKEKALTCKGRYYGQCAACAESCAETATCFIEDAAVISHAPIGCCINASRFNIATRAVTASRGLKTQSLKLVSSNILEKDTVYGAAEKLRHAISEADRRFKPKAIFIQASCASGIIGEDLESVANEEEQKLGYPIIPIYCEGFKSKVWSSGFDAAFHGILRKIVKPAKKKQADLVNVFNFVNSDTFSPLLAKLGLRVNYLAPLSSVQGLAEMTEAACSATICETLSTYINAVLEEKYGVPEVKAPAPYGIDWTDKWLREIAKYTNKTNIVDEVIEAEHERIKPRLDVLKEKLQGKSVYVIMGDSFAHNMANIVKDLGLKIAGVTALHHDQHTDSDKQVNTLQELVTSNGNIENFSVCNSQPYQIIKILKKVKPDFLLIRHEHLTTLGTKLGIPTFFAGDANITVGYDGVIKLGESLYEALRTKKLIDNIAEHAVLPYSDWWLDEVDDPLYFERSNK